MNVRLLFEGHQRNDTATSRIDNDRWRNTKYTRMLLDVMESFIEKLQYQRGKKAEGLT